MKKIAITLLIIFPFYSHALLIDNLVSYWDLDEASGSRVDAHGSNDLTDNNTVGSATGKIGNGADFELTNSESLTITDGTQTGLDILGDISFCTWANFESAPSNDAMSLVYKWAGGSGAYGFLYEDSGGTKLLKLNIYDSGSPGSNVAYTFNQTLTTATWYYLCVSYDASASTAEFYVDGASIGTDTDASANDINNSTGVFALGDLGSGVQWFMDGVLDETAIWDKVLTDAEVVLLYNSGNGLAYPLTEGGGGGATSTATTTSTTDTTNETLFHGFVLFFMSFMFTVWNFRSRKK